MTKLLTTAAGRLADSTVSAELRLTDAGDWRVTVLLARAMGEPPILPHDVKAELHDSTGSLAAVDEPQNIWIEAGGAAGTTANGVFVFAGRGLTPSRLDLTWRGEAVTLPVVTDR